MHSISHFLCSPHRHHAWRLLTGAAAVSVALLVSACALAPPEPKPYVRVAELQVDATQLKSFEVAAATHVAAATRLEAGILAFHTVAEKADPTRIRVFEMYESEAAYRAHLQSPHFEAFLAATQDLIVSRQLFDVVPVYIGSKKELPPYPVVRVADLEILPARLGDYRAAVSEEIADSIRSEPGVAAIYAVSLKDAPQRLRFFEIYADDAAYRQHIASAHFRKYVDTTKNMIAGRRLLETESSRLYIKP
jgi:quinol monooxygenase YgiN